MALLPGLLHKHPTMIRSDSWSSRTHLDATTSWLDGTTVAIIGGGGIGRALAAMLRLGGTFPRSDT